MKVFVFATCFLAVWGASLRSKQTLQVASLVAKEHVRDGLKRSAAKLCNTTASGLIPDSKKADPLAEEMGAMIGKAAAKALFEHSDMEATIVRIGEEVGAKQGVVIASQCQQQHASQLERQEKELLAISVEAFAEKLGREDAKARDEGEDDEFWPVFARKAGWHIGNAFAKGLSKEEFVKKANALAHEGASSPSQVAARHFGEQLRLDLPDKLRDKVNEELGLPPGTVNNVY